MTKLELLRKQFSRLINNYDMKMLEQLKNDINSKYKRDT